MFKPTESQNFRFTYNRAYSTPANFSFFLDLIQAHNAGGLPYDVRAMGVPPEGGWDYRRSCSASLAGGLCMRSPFVSTLGAREHVRGRERGGVLPNGARHRQAAASLVGRRTRSHSERAQSHERAGGFGAALSRRQWQRGRSGVVTHIDPLKASFVNNYEVGYKGLAGNSTRLSASGWYQQRINFITAAQISTPNVFLEPNSLGAYLGAQITGALIAQGMPAAQAQATAAAAAPAIAAGLAKVPLGTVTFDNAKLANRPDVLFTYRNVDKTITLWGLDLGFDQTLTDRFSVEGTYSFVNKDSFSEVADPGAGPLRINSPKNKGSLTGHFNDDRRGFKAELRARYTEGFAVNSGVYASGVTFSSPGTTCNAATNVGCYQYPAVPTAILLDAGFSMSLPQPREGSKLVRERDQPAGPPGPDVRRCAVARPPRHDAAAVQLLRSQVSGLSSQVAGFRCCHRGPAAFV